MIIDLNIFFGIILYTLLIILIIIFIILGIKLIRTLKKVDNVIDDVNDKISKVDGIFNLIDKTTDYASSISDKVINWLSNFINSLFRKKKGKYEDE